MPSEPPDKEKEPPANDQALPDIPHRQDLPDESTVVDRILIKPEKGDPFIIIRTNEVDDYEGHHEQDHECDEPDAQQQKNE